MMKQCFSLDLYIRLVYVRVVPELLLSDSLHPNRIDCCNVLSICLIFTICYLDNLVDLVVYLLNGLL